MTSAATFERTFEIRAPRQRVWGALTDPAELVRWFAEHAELSDEPGGPYRFWGRYTPTFGGPAHADQILDAIQPGEMLAFTWRWAGVQSRCEMRLQDDGACTALTLRHELDKGIIAYGETETCWVVRDFWQVAMANLDEYVRKGEPAILVDHSADGGDIELSIEIDASPEAVWAAITEPSEIMKWLDDELEPAPTPTIDLRVGGDDRFGWTNEEGAIGPQKVLELDAGKRLVYSWRHKDDQTDKTEWLVEDLGGGRTKLTVRQLNTGSMREASGYGNGWAFFLSRIKASHE